MPRPAPALLPRLLLLLSILALAPPPAAAQRLSMPEYQRREMLDYFGGVAMLGRNHARGYRVFQQLQAHSGMTFRVYPQQTFQWGQAHAGGVILLDVSTLQKPTPILAFIFAHEWGHEALGHQPNLYNPHGNVWRFRATPTADEDAADRYAGEFLAAAGYPVEPVVRFLRTLPHTPGDFAHSDGPERARTVRAAYDARRGVAGSGAGAGPRCRTVTEWEERTEWVTRMVSETAPCQHCGCDAWGRCGCAHPADVVQVPRQVPVARRVPVQRRVCR